MPVTIARMTLGLMLGLAALSGCRWGGAERLGGHLTPDMSRLGAEQAASTPPRDKWPQSDRAVVVHQPKAAQPASPKPLKTEPEVSRAPPDQASAVPASLSADAPPASDRNPASAVEIDGPSSIGHDAAKPAGPEEMTRLLKTLQAFLDDRPGDALQLLKQYPRKDQEMLLALLPIVAQAERKVSYATKMDETQKLAVIEVLRSLTRTLEQSAPLVITKLGFARRVTSFGRYEPLLTPTFRPSDQALLYAEIDNLHDERASDTEHVIRLGCKLTIRREGATDGWQLPVRVMPDVSLSPRDDHHAEIKFRIPSREKGMEPGAYLLRVEIIDQHTRRTAERVIPFRVTSQVASRAAE